MLKDFPTVPPITGGPNGLFWFGLIFAFVALALFLRWINRNDYLTEDQAKEKQRKLDEDMRIW